VNNNKGHYLILETNEIFEGIGYGKPCNSYGELVFNTATTGYQEVITDPSYKGQVIVFTYPHIGNVGVCSDDNESQKALTKAIITREIPSKPSNWSSEESLNEFLNKNNISGICNIDTRELTKIIREKGNIFCLIVKNDLSKKEAYEQLLKYKKSQTQAKKYIPEKDNKTQINQYSVTKGKLNIIILDLGYKASIVSVVKKYNHNITITNLNHNKNLNIQKYDAIIISNGPGDPNDYIEEIKFIKQLINSKIPILGICLGHQLLALALGGKIENLQYGHHGINHPVKQLDNNKVFITSQNHNYTVSKKYLPNYLDISHISLFDHTIQGFMHKKQIIYGFQGHPEGSPGPVDIQNSIFKKFFEEVCLKKLNQY